ncbi:MAG TPA: hypothetical protein VLC09_21110 [Polyangiaceae bacterium]|nr:hypothetical protein [Polyangiaceae bacterium]
MSPRHALLNGGLVALALSVGCTGTDPLGEIEALALEGNCLVNSDCREPLVCAFRRCHVQCTTSRDCEGNSICLQASEQERVCRLESEASCRGNADCPVGLVCAVDGSCRVECGSAADCLADQICAQGTCAEAAELDSAGLLDQVLTPLCSADAECEDGQLCRFGACVDECRADEDCAVGLRCSAGACVSELREACGEPDDCTDDGARCESGECVCDCRADVDCASGSRCEACACVPTEGACESSADCDDGQLCVEGECSCECREDVDCGPGQACDGCGCVAQPLGLTIDTASVTNSLDLALLDDVARITGTLTIQISGLPSCEAVSNLERVGSLVMKDSALLDMSCFSSLKRIDYELALDHNPSLVDFGFRPDLQIGKRVTISGSPLLSSCDYDDFFAHLRVRGFRGNMSIGGDLCMTQCQGPVCLP